MDDAALVRKIQRVKQFAHDAHGFLQLEALVGVEEILEFLALNELHDDVGDVGLLTEVVHLDNVGMVEARDGLGLAHEPHRVFLGGLIVVHVALEDGLDGHLAVQLGVHPLVDDAHRALAEHASEVVAAELLKLLSGGSHGRSPEQD